jgi:hypothetical protein
MYEVFDYRTGEVLFARVPTRPLAVLLCRYFKGTDFDTRVTVKED